VPHRADITDARKELMMSASGLRNSRKLVYPAMGLYAFGLYGAYVYFKSRQPFTVRLQCILSVSSIQCLARGIIWHQRDIYASQHDQKDSRSTSDHRSSNSCCEVKALFARPRIAEEQEEAGMISQTATMASSAGMRR
jgi:hypothetical protein